MTILIQIFTMIGVSLNEQKNIILTIKWNKWCPSHTHKCIFLGFHRLNWKIIDLEFVFCGCFRWIIDISYIGLDFESHVIFNLLMITIFLKHMNIFCAFWIIIYILCKHTLNATFPYQRVLGPLHMKVLNLVLFCLLEWVTDHS